MPELNGPRVLIIRMRNVPAIDSTAVHALKDLVRRTQPLIALGRSGLLDEIGDDNLFGDVDAALEAARQRLQPAPLA